MTFFLHPSHFTANLRLLDKPFVQAMEIYGLPVKVSKLHTQFVVIA